MKRYLQILWLAAAVLPFAAPVLTFAAPRNLPPAPLAAGEGRQQTVSYCSSCHSTEYIPMNAPAQDAAGWQKTVTKMVQSYGAPIPEQDQKLIVNYLSAHYSQKRP
jgi:hypothetical protein